MALIIQEIQEVGTNNAGDSGCWHQRIKQLELIIREIQAVGWHQSIQAVGTNNSGDSGCWHQRIQAVGTNNSGDSGSWH